MHDSRNEVIVERKCLKSVVVGKENVAGGDIIVTVSSQCVWFCTIITNLTLAVFLSGKVNYLILSIF